MKYIKEFFFLNLNQYENISTPFPIGMVSIALAIFMCIGAVYYYYYKNYTCALLRALKRHEAKDEESAKTLKELRLHTSYSIKRALLKQGKLSSLVKEVGKKQMSYEEYLKLGKKARKPEKADFEKARYYIPNDKKDIAASEIEKCPSLLTPILTCVIAITALLLLFFFLDPLLELINKSAGK